MDDTAQTTLKALDRQIAFLQRYRVILQQKKMPVTQGVFSGTIEIIGGGGQLGRVFVKAFRQLGCQVNPFEQADWDTELSRLQNASAIIICVPVHKTVDVIHALPKLLSTCILADFTSIKVPIVDAMCTVHNGPVVGLHPMFGPHSQQLTGQTLAVCAGQQDAACEPLLHLFEALGLQIEQISATEHDKAMGFIQALRHFNTFSDGVFLAKNAVDLTTLSYLSSPIYRLELSLVGRLFAQTPELYVDIILAGQQRYQLITTFCQHHTMLAKLVEAEDREGLITLFKQTQAFLGDFAQESLHSSEPVLVANT